MTQINEDTRAGLADRKTLRPIGENLYLYESTCNVYVLRNGSSAVLVDFGDGSVLNALAGVGIDTVTDVLMTHHHRDQGQGLPLADSHGIRIWVPSAERDLFGAVDAHWQGRTVLNNYNVRQDRFSLLEPVKVAGMLEDYARYFLGGYTFEVLPTPGHTVGSVSLLVEMGGRKIAFTGDLIAGPGQVWSMAATQWSYNGAEGAAVTCLSLKKLVEQEPDLLLPSHGAAIHRPQEAIELLFTRLRALLDVRGENPRMLRFLREPYTRVTNHLLRNPTGFANCWVLLSESGKALMIDYGYDFVGGVAPETDRSSRRPWLYTLPTLKRDFGVTKVDVMIPTHYHDDHVAGMNLLQRVEGTELWVPENFAAILANPERYDMPCLWYDPIHADRVLPVGAPVQWEEYTLHIYPFRGHTRYEVGIFVEVDGKRMLFTGDQYQSEGGLKWNYVYQNHFNIGDYCATAQFYAELKPDLILTGHWAPITVTPEFLQTLLEQAACLEQMHKDLLLAESLEGSESNTPIRIEPYQSKVRPGQGTLLEVFVFNPLPEPAEVRVEFAAPDGWVVEPTVWSALLGPGAEAVIAFTAAPPADAAPARRVRLAVDVTAGDRRIGQQAECLIDILKPLD